MYVRNVSMYVFTAGWVFIYDGMLRGVGVGKEVREGDSLLMVYKGGGE